MTCIPEIIYVKFLCVWVYVFYWGKTPISIRKETQASRRTPETVLSFFCFWLFLFSAVTSHPHYSYTTFVGFFFSLFSLLVAFLPLFSITFLPLLLHLWWRMSVICFLKKWCRPLISRLVMCPYKYPYFLPTFGLNTWTLFSYFWILGYSGKLRRTLDVWLLGPSLGASFL